MHENDRPILRVRGVVKRYGARAAVDGVSFELWPGEVLALVGESGSGKSTIARMIPRLIEPTSGEIHYGGRNLVTLGEREMRAVRQEIGIVFQNPFSSLNPRMSVRQLIGEPLLIHKRAGGAALDRRVEEMMELVGCLLYTSPSPRD